MKLTFFGGLNEIGGNKILLEYKSTKIFLDFGKSFSKHSLFFEEYLNPRRINGLGDFLALGLIPRLEGLYRPDYLEMLEFTDFCYKIPKHKKPKYDAIFVSHPHADHIDYISFLDPKIPIFLTEDALKVIKVLDLISQETLENEIYDFKLRDKYGKVPSKKKDQKKIIRKFRIIKPYKKLKFKDIYFWYLPVEHSIPGACMILIEAGKNKILYTGDFRLKGSLEKASKTSKTLEFLKKFKIDIALFEGTRIKEKKIINEFNVYNDAKKALENIKNLILLEFSFKDLSRFETFLKIAKELKRTLLFPSDWFCYIKFLDKYGFNIPKSWKKYVKLFKRRKITFRGSWEKEIYKNEKGIEFFEVRKNQEKFILGISFYRITDIIDVSPKNNSIYIQSTSEPFNEEMFLDLERLKNWLSVFKIKQLIKPHASGHISGKELEEVILSLKIKNLIPIHTEHPEVFKDINKNSIILYENTISF